MRIVVNALSVVSGGGLVSMRELLPALREVDKNNEYIVVMTEGQRALIGNLPDEIRTHVVRAKFSNVLLRVMYEQLVLPIILKKLGADWLYSVGNQTVLLASCRICILMENPNPYSRHPIDWTIQERTRQLVLRVLARLSCWRASKVRFLTENSSRILRARLGIPERKTCVIPHGVRILDDSSGSPAVGDSITLPSHYVFASSNVAPHKNIDTLMKGFDLYVQRYGYEGSLVIAGGLLYKEYYERLKALRSQLPSAEKIIFLGWIRPEDLGKLYKRADLFVFPSIEETFGIPLIEAMAYGAPVLASKADVGSGEYFIPFEEIGGSAALYFDPFDPVDLATQMHRLGSDPELRTKLVADGKARAREFSWLTTATLLSQQFDAS